MTKALSATRPHPADALFRIADAAAVECSEQDARWGEQNHPDGTGLPHDVKLAEMARQVTQYAAAAGKVTWRHILNEEVREAFAETDPDKLYGELKQVVAVGMQWMKAILRRKGGLAPRVYVSGQITGLDRDKAMAAFAGDCAALATFGFQAVNPFDIPHPTDCSCSVQRDGEHLWECCLTKDLRVLVTCDAIYMRADWRNSRGAILEHDTAKALGLVVVYGAPDGTCCEVCEQEIIPGQAFDTLSGVGLYTHLDCEPATVREAIEATAELVTDVEIAEAMAHDINDDLAISTWHEIREDNGGWDDSRIQLAAAIADEKHGDHTRYPAAVWCRHAITAFHDLAGAYVRERYAPLAHIHTRVTVDGVEGYIVGFDGGGGKLRVQLLDRAYPIVAHPTWRVVYHTTEDVTA